MAEYFFGITDKGKQRKKNEDTFIAQEVLHKEFLVACVIDGVGGYNGGDVAAEIARSVILEHLQNLSGDVIETLQTAIVAANAKINDERKKEDKNEHMACVLTCAVAHIKNNKFYYAHVGDTRLYLLRDHSLVKISKDHSVVGFLEESGRLSEEDAMRHPRRNEINKALGFEEAIDTDADFIETGESPFLPGDLIFLCSDGLSDMISSNSIMSILVKNKSLAAKAKELVNAANDAGGKDNITAVLVENNKKPMQPVASIPVERKNNNGRFQIPENKAQPVKDVVAKKRTGRALITFLTFLSIGLLTALLVILFQKNTKPMKNNNTSGTKITMKKNENFAQLISYVNDSSKTYALQQGGSFLEVSDPILINKDTFRLIGNGATLTCDSNYKDAAIIIDPSAKHIVLDSLVFKDFDVAIIVQKNNITLRNVRFINCRVPIQYLLSVPDSAVTGRLKDSVFISNSTLK